MTKLPKTGMFRFAKPDLKAGDRVRVVIGSKEVECNAVVVASPDGDYVTVRTVKVLIEGEKVPRKIGIDRIVSKDVTLS